ncbi:unnamed protein product [Heterotrigona itama]|uniref:Uncharacterized protein n=1 Tax=Heterotrigona itama TaxID=395501 RepID=A0A6V7GVD7_9HYME|nr:unnamed protein product [Heterotrigona itama]
MQMHPRAFYMSVLVILVADGACCDDNRWYTGLRTVLKNCPLESWNSSWQDEFLEKFRKCMQEHALAALDSLLADDIIPVFEGLDLVRFQEDRNSTDNYRESEIGDDTNWTAVIVKRLLRILRTHVFKVDVDHFTNHIISLVNNEETDVAGYKFEGRRRHRRRHNHMVPLMMMGFLLMGSILIPMGFQFLAVLGGKALLLAKMALILSSIQGLKKIATNGVNYGLYHAHPVAEGWHDRSHIEPSHLDLPFPPPLRP